MKDDSHVWVKTMPGPNGGYVVTLEATQNRSMVLTPKVALKHAYGVLAAAERADYDAAVFQQMMKVADDEQAAGKVVVDLRSLRPRLSASDTYPLMLEPGVSLFTKEPYLALHLAPAKKGDPPVQLGTWSVSDARQHAMYVLIAVQAAENDAGYYQVLTNEVGLEKDRARNVIDDLGKYRVQE